MRFWPLLILTFLALHVQSQGVSTPCSNALSTGDYQQARKVCSAQLQAVEPGSEAELLIYLSLADIAHALGETERESNYLKTVKDHSIFHQSSEAQYKWNRKMGQKFYVEGDFFRSGTHLISALNMALNENNEAWLSKSFNDVGLVSLKQGNFKEALTNFEKSLELKRKSGDLYLIGTTLNNLGLTQVKLEEFDSGMFYYQQAMEVFLKYTEQVTFDHRVAANISHLYEDLTRIYVNTGQLDDAEHYAKEILKTFQLKFSPHEQARALLNIAKLYVLKDQKKLARDYLQQAYQLDSDYVDVLFEYAKVQNQLGDKQRATTLAFAGLSLAEQGSHPLLPNFYQLLSELYRSNDLARAFEYLKKYQAFREQFLKKKYDSELKTIQFQIEKEQIQNNLIKEQLANSENKAKIQALTQWVIVVFSLLIFCLGFVFFYRYKKKKEHEALLMSISFHKQQLLTQVEPHKSKPHNANIEEQFKEQMVKTLVTALDIWEKHTGTNRVEFAEKSKLWTVSVDNGTLRTRSLDKYLKLDKLPKNPRWRPVANSCHFILSDANLATEDRAALSAQLDQLMYLYEQLSIAT